MLCGKQRARAQRIAAIAHMAICLLAVRAAAATQPSASGPNHVRLQLKWYHQFQFAGYYAAQAKGFYAEENLEVEVIPGDVDHPPIQQVISGHADFGVSDADVLKAFLAGQPLVVLAAIFQHSPYVLMTRADSGLRTPSALRGKSIMLSDEQGIVQLKAMFRREGMSLQDVMIVPHRWDNDLLIRGQVDAISAYATVEPFHLKAKGVEPAMIRAMDYGVDFYGDTLFTTQDHIRRDRALVEAFRRASLRGWEYAMEHPQEMVEWILELPGVHERGVTREMLSFEAQAMRDLILPGLVEIGHMNPGRWQAIARIYGELGLTPRVPTEAELDRFIYSEAPPSRDSWIKPLLFTIGSIAVLAAGVLLWNLQLRRVVARRTAALQKAKQELSYHVENSPLAVIEWDRNFRVTRWTGQAEQAFGWTATDVLGKHPDDFPFVFEEDKPLTDQVMADLTSGRKRRNIIQNRNYRKDGSVVMCEWYNSGSLDEHGAVRSIFSLVLDVTVRRTAETALARERAFLEAVLQACPAGIVAAEATGRIVRMNAANERLWGLDPYSQSVGAYCGWKGWWADGSARHGQALQPQDWAMARALRGEVCPGDIVEIEPFDSPPGTRRTMINSAAPVRGASGEIIGAVVAQTDITELQQAERRVRASERRLAAVLEALPTGVAIADANGRVTHFNAALTRIWGGPPIPQSTLEYGGWHGRWAETGQPLGPDDWAMARALRTGLPVTGDVIEIEKFDGSGTATIINAAAPIFDGQGRISGGVLAEVDITEQKRAEAAAAELQRKLNAALMAGEIGTYEWRLDQDRVWGDPNFSRISGLKLDASGSAPLSAYIDVIHPEDRASVLEGTHRTVQTGCHFHAEYRIGTGRVTRWVVARGTGERDASGRVVRFPGVLMDITERKQAEAALRESEHQFRALAASMPQLVWMTNPVGQVEYFNERWYQYTGQNSSEALGAGWLGVLHPEDREATQACWSRSTSQGHKYEIQYRLRGQDGCYRWFLARGLPLHDADGRIRRWFGTCTDIDEQRRTVEALRESERRLSEARNELARANEHLEKRVEERTHELRETITELEQMSYSMIHDLRAPLRAIQSFGGIIQEESGHLLTTEGQDMLRRIIAAADRMDHLVRDMLNYAKVVGGELPLTPVDVAELARDIIATYPAIRAADLEITVRDLPRVRGNPAALTQCLAQLLTNAVKFTRNGGLPVIRVSGETRPQGWVRIVVEDQGPGIAPEYVHKIFGLFQRLKTPGAGTGMGLAIAKKAIDRMGGRVGVDSTVGVGSRFWLELPGADAPSGVLKNTGCRGL